MRASIADAHKVAGLSGGNYLEGWRIALKYPHDVGFGSLDAPLQGLSHEGTLYEEVVLSDRLSPGALVGVQDVGDAEVGEQVAE